MNRIPLLTAGGVADLLVSCKRGDEAWERADSDELYELAKNQGPRTFEREAFIHLDPPLLDPSDAALIESASYRTDAALLERWHAAGVQETLTPALATDTRYLVSLACFALAEYAKPRWLSSTAWTPERQLLMDGQPRMTREPHRIYHTSARLWWIYRFAQLGTPRRAPEDELLHRARILAMHPQFFHRLFARPLTVANRKVLAPILNQVRENIGDKTKQAHINQHLLKQDTVAQWVRKIALQGSGRFLDVLSEEEVERIVREATPPDKSREARRGPASREEMLSGRAKRRTTTIPSIRRVLSLGGGVQSVTLYLLAATGDERLGEFPDLAVFADTGWEPKHVYQTIEVLKGRFGDVLPIEVARQSEQSNLYLDTLHGRQPYPDGKPCLKIPVWLDGNDGKGQWGRDCTGDYKISPILKLLRAEIGMPPRTKVPNGTRAEMWLGISIDEVSRIRPNREWWISNRYPLISEMRWSRADCAAYLLETHPEIPVGRSACMGCPYHGDAEWARLVETEPSEVERLIELDEKLRQKVEPGHRLVDATPYLHRSRRPLRDALADLAPDNGGDGMGENCEGYCGI